MSEQLWPTPDSWVWTTVGEIGAVIGGGTPTSTDETNFSTNGIPWITPADLTDYSETYITRGRRDLSEKGFKACGAQLLPPSSVLFSSRAPIGYCAIAKGTISTNQGFKSIVLHQGIAPEFIRHYLLSIKDIAEMRGSGNTFKELSGARMKTLPVPIAPPHEQKRIVAKLDSVFARTRRAREELTRIPRLIERYKQAILSAAFSGELTEDWRSKVNADNTWQESALGTVLLDLRYGTSKKCRYAPSETVVLRIPNIGDGQIVADDLKHALFTEQEKKALSLKVGDILLIRSNGSLDLVGKSALVSTKDEGYIFAGYLIRLRLRSVAASKYVLYYLKSPRIRRLIEQVSKSTSGVNNINSQELRSLPFRFPAMPEQEEIIRRIESAFAFIDKLASESSSATRLLEHLDQATLAKAFRGELVPQDPNDEPASALLERIKAERPTTTATRKRRAVQ